MFGFFKKKGEVLIPAMSGEIVALEKVPDLVFSQKMIGDGFAIIPTKGLVVAPIEGTIVQIFPTNHAFGIVSESGLEVLVHIGIDTVELKGEGFERLAEVDQFVTAGTPIIKIDLEFIKKHAKSAITPVVITNKEKVKSMTVNYGKNPKVAATIEMN